MRNKILDDLFIKISYDISKQREEELVKLFYDNDSRYKEEFIEKYKTDPLFCAMADKLVHLYDENKDLNRTLMEWQEE